MTLKFDGWPWKTIGHPSYATSSFAHHFKAIDEFKLELQSGNAQFGSKSAIFCPCDPDIWWMTSKNKRAPLLCYFKLYASFHSHQWIQAWVTVRKRPIWVKIGDFLSRVTLTFGLWPWPFAWISLLSMVITPEIFMMMRWEEHCEKRATDGQTDGQMERSVLRAAWSQLKIYM